MQKKGVCDHATAPPILYRHVSSLAEGPRHLVEPRTVQCGRVLQATDAAWRVHELHVQRERGVVLQVRVRARVGVRVRVRVKVRVRVMVRRSPSV